MTRRRKECRRGFHFRRPRRSSSRGNNSSSRAWVSERNRAARRHPHRVPAWGGRVARSDGRRRAAIRATKPRRVLRFSTWRRARSQLRRRSLRCSNRSRPSPSPRRNRARKGRERDHAVARKQRWNRIFRPAPFDQARAGYRQAKATILFGYVSSGMRAASPPQRWRDRSWPRRQSVLRPIVESRGKTRARQQFPQGLRFDGSARRVFAPASLPVRDKPAVVFSNSPFTNLKQNRRAIDNLALLEARYCPSPPGFPRPLRRSIAHAPPPNADPERRR